MLCNISFLDEHMFCSLSVLLDIRCSLFGVLILTYGASQACAYVYNNCLLQRLDGARQGIQSIRQEINDCTVVLSFKRDKTDPIAAKGCAAANDQS